MHRYYCKHGDVVSPYNSCIFWSHHLRWSNQEVDKKCKGYYWNNMLWRKVTEEKFPRINCKLSGELWSVSIPTIGQRSSVVMLLAKLLTYIHTNLYSAKIVERIWGAGAGWLYILMCCWDTRYEYERHQERTPHTILLVQPGKKSSMKLLQKSQLSKMSHTILLVQPGWSLKSR